jgi:putative oxidoreductase
MADGAQIDGEEIREWRTRLRDVGLLILRVWPGSFMLAAHGWGKLSKFSASPVKFPDPLGVGATLSLSLTVFAEVGCAALIVVGLATRLAALPLVITMLVAALVIHGDDPWSKKEFALLYAAPFAALLFTGPGRLSLDRLVERWWSRRSS